VRGSARSPIPVNGRPRRHQRQPAAAGAEVDIVNATARYGIPLADGDLFVYTDWSYRSKINFFLYEAAEFTGKPLTEGGLRRLQLGGRQV
jgi:hypothetical protein